MSTALQNKIIVTTDDLANLLATMFGNRKFVVYAGNPIDVVEGNLILYRNREKLEIYNAIYSGRINDLTNPKQVQKWEGKYIDLTPYITTTDVEATYAKKADYVSTQQLNTKLADYVTSEAMNRTIPDISGLLAEANLDTKATTLGYIKSTTLDSYLSKTELSTQIDNLGTIAKKTDLPNMSNYMDKATYGSKIDEKLNTSTYEADKATFALQTTVNQALSTKLDNTALNNYSTSATTNTAIKSIRFDSGSTKLYLQPIVGNEIEVDISDLRIAPIYSSIKFDNDSNELVFNDGRSDTRISLSKFLDHIDTPDATEDIKGKLALKDIDTRVVTKLTEFKQGELQTSLSAKLDASTYNAEKANFITNDTLASRAYLTAKSSEITNKLDESALATRVDDILATKGYLTASSNEITSKLSEATYNTDKKTYVTKQSLATDVDSIINGKLTTYATTESVNTSLGNYVSIAQLDSEIGKLNKYALQSELRSMTIADAQADVKGKISLNEINSMIDAKIEAATQGNAILAIISKLTEETI